VSVLVESFVSEVTKLAKLDPKRWDEVIVDAPHAVLTKKHVFNYYSEPKVKRVLLTELEDRDAIVRQSFQKDFVVLKRKEKEKNIRITSHGLNVEDPHDLSYFTERRATEFHPVQKKMDTRVVVDLDPSEDFSFKDAKTVAGQVKDIVSKMPGIKDTHVRFSGGNGFYVVGHLAKPAHVDKVREQLKTALGPLTEADDRLTLGVAKKDQLRLDLSPMKEAGSFRGLYSLNVATGLVSVPVKDLATFDPAKHATIDAVLGRKPKDYKHAR
jgi:DNA primase